MKKQDVVIIGGGLAGLTLALQLINQKSDLNILVLDKRKRDDIKHDHKVGESTVELGTYYLREVLDLKGYLDKFQLPKRGLRYFISPEHKNDIEKRLEIGPKNVLPVPSHQIDRGLFEFDLMDILKEKGVQILNEASVSNVDLDNGNHTIDFEVNGNATSLNSQWVIDSSGRNFFFKKKLELSKDTEHNINAVWWRYEGVVDIEEWSTNDKWLGKLDKGIRKLATIHLMDKGYWVWIIPQVTGNTSIGIVADPKIHPLHTYNSYEKSMEWLALHEPQAHEKFKEKNYNAINFKALKNFSYDSKQFYSKDRWAVTGESGAFLDPFYSPGTDFIALNNSWIANLIERDFAGEDIRMPVMLFEITNKSLFENWVPIYNNKYALFGSSQIMTFKVFWDWTVYWGIPTIAFVNNGYTNLDTLKRLFAKGDSPIPKFAIISKKMQNFFLDWLPYDDIKVSDHYIDFIEMDFIHKLHFDLDKKMTQDELCTQIEENLVLLEQVATYIYKVVSKEVFELNTELNIDPYTFDLKEGRDALLAKSAEIEDTFVPESIKNDIDKMWLKKAVV